MHQQGSCPAPAGKRRQGPPPVRTPETPALSSSSRLPTLLLWSPISPAMPFPVLYLPFHDQLTGEVYEAGLADGDSRRGLVGSGALRCSFSLDPICFHQLPHPSTLEWDALPPQPCTDPLEPRDSGSAPLLYAPRLWEAGGTSPHKQRCPDVLQAQWAFCATWLSIVHPTPTSVSIKSPS